METRSRSVEARFGWPIVIATLLVGLYAVGCGGGGPSVPGGGSASAPTMVPVISATPISQFANDPVAPGAQVIVTSPNTLAAGAVILISGTTNYNGIYTVVSATATTFTITKVFVSDDATGVWQPGGGLKAGCSTLGDTGAITLSNSPSRVSGVAPLAVFFDATATTATETSRPFHELEYRWNFADGSSGNWANGARPGANTRNVARGPVAAHVFETEGTYDVTLTITDGTNTVTSNCIRIAVVHPDVAYPGLNTVCVGAGVAPGIGGCPANAATDPIADFCAAVTTHIGPNKRVLFKTGDTFACAAATTIASNGPWTIGAFGGSTKPKVASNQPAGGVIAVGAGAGVFPADGRIMDLEITGTVPGNSMKSVVAVGNMDQLTLLRLNIHDVGDGPQFVVNIINIAGNNHVWDNLAIVDSTIKTIQGGGGTHGVFAFTSRFALMGNLIDDAVLGEHLVRLDYLGGAVISNNTLRNSEPTKETMAIRGTENNPAGAVYQGFVLPAPSPTKNVVISDNDFTIDSDTGLKLGPANSTIQVVIQNVISERNVYHAPVTAACGGGLCAQNAIATQADGHTIRNELIKFDNFKFYTGVLLRAATTGMAAASNIDIIHNSIFSSLNSANGVVAITVLEAGVSNINITNNLAYAPATTSTSFVALCLTGCGGLSGLSVTNNSTDSSGTNEIRNTSPNFTATPTPTVLITDWKPTTPIAGVSGVSVWSDFYLGARPPNALGAVLP